jgi:hypothetical protein
MRPLSLLEAINSNGVILHGDDANFRKGIQKALNNFAKMADPLESFQPDKVLIASVEAAKLINRENARAARKALRGNRKSRRRRYPKPWER